MDTFDELLKEVQSRLLKGISVGKELKMEHRIRESTASIGHHMPSIETTGDMIDLKAEMVAMKNKMFLNE